MLRLRDGDGSVKYVAPEHMESIEPDFDEAAVLQGSVITMISGTVHVVTEMPDHVHKCRESGTGDLRLAISLAPIVEYEDEDENEDEEEV